VDIHHEQTGRGIGGRMVDALLRNGYKASLTSTAGSAEALASKNASSFVVDPLLNPTLNPNKSSQSVERLMRNLNQASKLGSNLYGEHYANKVLQASDESNLLKDVLDIPDSGLFPDSDLGLQFNTISKMMKKKDLRGVDRDVFFAKIGHFDTHSDINSKLNERTKVMNTALVALTNDLKTQNLWNNTTIIFLSEFARTLSPNTGAGTDHAWGQINFITGGSVSGSQILGKYPSDLSNDGDLIIEPGIVIPSLSWESMWNSICQWFGIDSENDLDEVLPNRHSFTPDLFSKNDLFSSLD